MAAERVGLPLLLHRVAAQRGLIVPLGFVMLLAVLLVPLPPVLLDLLISLNIALAVIVLLTTIYMERPLDFSVFPSLLLATTMFRLVLNIASTRLILTADASSPEQASAMAGHVIRAFGEFVAGDSLFVGIVIALILLIVQFVVVTKGATRISEVAARFTLDAMPGKQMAIDSDLNAGLIDEKEARRRRDEIRQEADFFGAMDGASKFVRGDAIAGIIILAVNIVGGLAVGLIDKGWPVAETAEVFTTLTIGDGLTSQVPSFVISLASALIVTRSGSRLQLGDELTGQLASQPKGLLITALFLGALALTPLPTLPLLGTAAVFGLVAMGTMRTERAARAKKAERPSAPEAPEPAPIETLLKIDTLELELGYSLVALADPAQRGDLLDRVQATRRQLASELGLVMPPVRIRDNIQLDPNEYRLRLRGAEIARGSTRPGRLLAMDAGLASGSIEGERTSEPAFGLDAVWIDPRMRARAEAMNYTVVDPASVLITHLTETVRRHAAELLSREEVNNLIEQLKQKAPKLVEEAIPATVKPAELQRVMQNLLRERVPIRDVETIVEALADWAPRTRDPDILTEYARHALRRVICDAYARREPGRSATLACVTLDPAFEDQVSGYIERSAAGTTVTMPSRVAAALAERIAEPLTKLAASGRPPVVVASPTVRAAVHQILEPRVPGVAVLGYNEVEVGVEVESVALVTLPPSASSANPNAKAA